MLTTCRRRRVSDSSSTAKFEEATAERCVPARLSVVVVGGGAIRRIYNRNDDFELIDRPLLNIYNYAVL